MENISAAIKTRVLQIAENKGVGKEKFFENLGLSYGNFKGRSLNSALSTEAVAEISAKYPDVSLEWLIMGMGNMYKKPELTIVAETPEPYTSFLRGDRKIKEQFVDLYDITATASIARLIPDTHPIPIDKIYIPNMPKVDGAIPITGDSMYPLLKAGDIVLYKFLNDLKNFIPGEMYLVSAVHNGDSYFSAKFVHRSETQGYLKLVSHNQHHQPVEFPMESIKALAHIKASIRYNSSF